MLQSESEIYSLVGMPDPESPVSQGFRFCQKIASNFLHEIGEIELKKISGGRIIRFLDCVNRLPLSQEYRIFTIFYTLRCWNIKDPSRFFCLTPAFG